MKHYLATVLQYSNFSLSMEDYKKTIVRATIHLAMPSEKRSKKTANELLKHLEDNQWQPNINLANEIETASKEFRANFKLKPE